MKFRITVIAFFVSLLLISTKDISAQDYSTTSTESIMTDTVIVLGNCLICKIRIEEAGGAVNGVHEITWFPSNETCAFTFDTEITNHTEIMTAIANVGHDTEWIPAPDSAYATLEGTCCLYDRWLIYYTGIEEDMSDLEVKITPNPGNGIYIVKANTEQYTDMMIYVFDITGKEVYSSSFNGNTTVDITSQLPGNYIMIISRNNKMIHPKKLINN